MKSLAYLYGLKLAESPGVALYPQLLKNPNPLMQQQYFTSTINGLMDDTPPVDPHSHMEEPGMINRVAG